MLRRFGRNGWRSDKSWVWSAELTLNDVVARRIQEALQVQCEPKDNPVVDKSH